MTGLSPHSNLTEKCKISIKDKSSLPWVVTQVCSTVFSRTSCFKYLCGLKAYTSGGFVCYDIPSDVIYTFCRQPEAFLAQTGKLQSDVRFPWLQLLFNLMTCLTKENKSVPGVLMLNFEKCKKKEQISCFSCQSYFVL